MGTTQRRLIWLLILALAVYALSGGILRTAGPKHWHAAVEPSPGTPASLRALAPLLQQAHRWLSQVQALADAAHARAHALGVAPHQHRHSAVLRHWHDAADDTVRLLADDLTDAGLADLKASAALGGAMLALALVRQERWHLQGHANGRWPQATAARWRSALPPPPVEPPIS